MVCVFPGVEEVLARPFLLTSILISDDLPTFERPINANSSLLPSGVFPGSVLLTLNSAEWMIMYAKVILVDWVEKISNAEHQISKIELGLEAVLCQWIFGVRHSIFI